jgi:hypothetical protein
LPPSCVVEENGALEVTEIDNVLDPYDGAEPR